MKLQGLHLTVRLGFSYLECFYAQSELQHRNMLSCHTGLQDVFFKLYFEVNAKVVRVLQKEDAILIRGLDR